MKIRKLFRPSEIERAANAFRERRINLAQETDAALVRLGLILKQAEFKDPEPKAKWQKEGF